MKAQKNTGSTMHVYVDAKPTETLEPSKANQHFFAALTSSNEEGIKDVTGDFKTTKGKSKAGRARRIAAAVREGEIGLMANVVTGKSNGQLAHLAVDTVNQVRNQIGAEWLLEDGKLHSLRWNGYDYRLKSALGTMVYGGLLPILCLPHTTFADGHSDIHGITIILDSLPGENERGMELLQAIARARPAASMWAQALANGLEIEIANLRAFTPSGGTRTPGKRHPNAILVDWIAAGAYAFHSPAQMQAANGYSDEQIDAFGSIWKEIEAQGFSKLMDLDNMPQAFFDFQTAFTAGDLDFS